MYSIMYSVQCRVQGVPSMVESTLYFTVCRIQYTVLFTLIHTVLYLLQYTDVEVAGGTFFSLIENNLGQKNIVLNTLQYTAL